MSVHKQSEMAAISVTMMAETCSLSRSHFYALIDAGVMPPPIRNASGKRPFYDLELQQKCLEVRRTGIGVAGQVVVFNRKRRANPKQNQKQTIQRPVSNICARVVEGVKSLELTTVTTEQVAAAISELFPGGTDGTEIGQVIRDVFVHLMANK